MEYPRQLTGRVWLLGNPYFSVYLVRGDDFSALIETGISATAGLVQRQLREVEQDLSRVELLLATHAHADHLGGGPVLKRNLPALRVATGSFTKSLLDKQKVRDQFKADDAGESARLIQLGEVKEPVPGYEDLEGMIDRVVEPEEIIDLGGIRLEAMEAPGHAVGGLVFWEPEQRVLFCSDCLGFILPPDRFCANYYVSLDDYWGSFNRLAGLDPAWVCPGHCGAFSGTDKDYFLEGSKAEIAWVLKRVRSRMPFKEVPPDLVEEVLERHYIRQARMFSPEMMRYCSELLIRRAAESRLIQG